MKILIVSAFFKPEITPRAFRTVELVKELLRRKIDVTLYIPFREIDDVDLLNNKYLHLKYLTKTSLLPKLPKGNNFLCRGIRFLFVLLLKWFQYPYIKLCINIPKTISNESLQYDMLISIAAPHAIHWGVERLLRRNRNLCKCWVADCGDPFMGDSVHKHPFYFRCFEERFCGRADFITIPIEAAKKAYYKPYQDKLRVIPQGFDFSKLECLKKNYKKNEKPVFAYAGAIYPGYRDLNALISYLSTLKTDFLFVLYTTWGYTISQYKKMLGDKLQINPLLPREELLDKLSKMEFVVNIENKSSAQLPSKLIDYTLTGRPILSIGNVIDYTIVDDFLEGNYEKGLHIDNIEQYDIKNVVDNFLNLHSIR